MKTEFNLSNEVQAYDNKVICYLEEDVKEFIKKVKQIFDIENSRMYTCYDIIEMIDKLAGERLI